MRRRCILGVMFCILIFIICSSKTVYAVTCELQFDDTSNSNGFVEKDGKLYYVITLSAKTYAGELSSVKCKIEYDNTYLEYLDLKDKTLDLGEKGVFKNQSYIQLYDNDNWKMQFNENECVFLGRNEENNRLKAIDNNKVDLVKLCFLVKDNVREKRAVYIDTQSDSTQILYAKIKSDNRYITNGVKVKQETENNKTNSEENKIEESKNNQNENLATSKLPQTGINPVMLLALCICIVIMIIFIIKKSKMKDIN